MVNRGQWGQIISWERVVGQKSSMLLAVTLGSWRRDEQLWPGYAPISRGKSITDQGIDRSIMASRTLPHLKIKNVH